MSGIAPGDVVVCIKCEWIGMLSGNFAPHPLPVLRGVYRVDRVGTQFDIYWLGLVAVGGRYDARCFRKIRPADPEFVELIKRVKVTA